MKCAYLGSGQRDYTLRPVHPYRREFWEFQTIIRGPVALVRPGDLVRIERGPMLWIFPPGDRHGWQGVEGQPCEVAVFHFDQVPSILQEVTGTSYLATRLERGTASRIARAVEFFMQRRAEPGVLDRLRVEHQCLELALLALAPWEQTQDRPSPESGRGRRVEAMTVWLAQHLHENPGVDSLSREFAISPAHLRRLFQAQLAKSPREVLERLKMQRAAELLAEGDEKLEVVAAACGFGSASSFSRAYKAHFGRSPRATRNED